MTDVLPVWLQALISGHGRWAVGLLVGLESLGLPLPGETALVAAAVYAGSTGQLSIVGVLLAALLGAIIGDSLGYLAGRRLGWPLLLRHGPGVGLTPDRLRLGRALFMRHGGKVVFLGRFVAFLRVLAASLAGASGMAWPRFLLCNAAGAVIWVGVFGGVAFALGTQAQRLFGPLGMAALALGIAGSGAAMLLVRREEARLLANTKTAPW